MELLSNLKSLFAAWSKNKWVFVPSLVAVPAAAILIVVSATQPDVISDTLAPGGNSSNALDDKESPEAKSKEEGSEVSPSASTSPSPSASSTASNPGSSSSSGGSTTGTRTPTPFVESASQAEAKQAAATYLNQEYQYSRPLFSRVIIIQMLRDDGYSLADATYASNAVTHNWSAEAELMANDLIAERNYSRSGLIAALRSDNFTSSEASFGVSQLEATYQQNQYWETLWLDQASAYLGEALNSSTNYSEVEANQYLRTAGFTSAEVSAVLADISDAYWESSATMSAMDFYYVPDRPTREQVESYLAGRGYTQSQITYAMDRL